MVQPKTPATSAAGPRRQLGWVLERQVSHIGWRCKMDLHRGIQLTCPLLFASRLALSLACSWVS
jgi:hypothetical protein